MSNNHLTENSMVSLNEHKKDFSKQDDRSESGAHESDKFSKSLKSSQEEFDVEVASYEEE